MPIKYYGQSLLVVVVVLSRPEIARTLKASNIFMEAATESRDTTHSRGRGEEMEFALYIGWHLLIPQPSSPERGPSTHGQVIRVSRSLWDHPTSAASLQRHCFRTLLQRRLPRLGLASRVQ